MYTVVVADDETEVRRALIRRVNWKEAGFQVVGEAENGAEALELAERLEPDLLLTDVRMPFMSGIELARAVREVRPAIQIAFLSGYDDFSYAQQAIQYNIISYMLKPVTSYEMTEELKKIRLKIDRKFEEFAQWTSQREKSEGTGFVMSLLLDPFSAEISEARNAELEKEAAASGFLKEKGSGLFYVVMVMSLRDSEGRNRTTPGSVNAVDSILRKYVHYTSFFSEGRVISLLSATRSGLNKYLHILVEEIVQSVRRITGLNALIGVSRETLRLANCHEAYMEAMNALRYSGRSDVHVHFISDIERSEYFDHGKIQNAVSRIEELLRGGSMLDLTEYLENMTARIRSGEIVPEAVRLLMVQVVAAAFRVVYAAAGERALQELQNLSPLQHQIFQREPARQWEKYSAFCVSAKQLVLEQRSRSGSVICDQALEMIRMQYSDPDLSLMSISNEISVTPNYLSALIKKSTGSTFVELLTKKRVEVAKELLLGSTMKIREIAQQCGYSDQHYFSYSFKKATGQSPNACRRQVEDEKFDTQIQTKGKEMQ